MESLMSNDSLLGQLADAFVRAIRQGKLPDIETYALNHPELAERIRELFPTLLLLEGMAAAYGSPTEMSPDPSGLSPGSVFGQYCIKREIGRGGMGIVYEARHLPLEKLVALKVLPVRKLMDAGQLDRFFREARTAAGLSHTNIVPVFDVGQVEGIPYYAMQYIEGRSLSAILHIMQSTATREAPERSSSDSSLVADSQTQAFPEPGTSPNRQKERKNCFFTDPSVRIRAGLPEKLEEYFRWVTGIGIQAAGGLAYAHERKIIHRDIKPSNLIMDERGVVWITDFGLARRIEDPALTQSGTLLGTPRYMSPEQAESARRPVDQRSDIYSLGATLYELITCRPVFDGKTPHEVISQIITRQPPAPKRLNAEIPVDLSTIVMKALAKRPEDRYQSASQFGEDLGCWLNMKPIKARRIGPMGWTIRWCRRNPRLVVVTAVAMAIILVLSGIYSAILRHEDAKARAAEERGQIVSNQFNLRRTLWWVYRDGHAEAIQAPILGYFAPSLSPDGTKLAYSAGQNGNRDIWILNLDDGNIKRVTSYAGGDFHPIWSPDGQRIAFTSPRVRQMIPTIKAVNGIFSKAADGSGVADLLGALPGKMIVPCSWTKDGRLIINSAEPGFRNQDIGILSLGETRTYTPLLGSYEEFHPQLSPDGKWLAYTSNESGTMNVYVCAFPDANEGKWRISTNGGSGPRWSRDEKELYYLTGEFITDAVMAVDVEMQSTFSHGKPRVLFRGKYVSSKPDYAIPYDVHPDGHRFLMMKN
jgi:serine/threonine protein kinase